MQVVPPNIQAEGVLAGEITATKLSTASRDRFITGTLDLSSTDNMLIFSINSIPHTVMTAETRLSTAMTSTGDAVITLYNADHSTGHAIGTITIASAGAQYEKDTCTTPDATYKVIAASGYITAKVTTAATTSGVAELIITIQPSEA